MIASERLRTRKPLGTPEWIFRWRGSRQPLFPRLFALMLVGGVFALLVTTVKIRVDVPEKASLRKASVIYLTDDAQGRALTLRAQEGGPFPSRFVLSQWSGLAELEASAMETARFQPQPYVPQLQDLPAERGVLPLELAAKGVAFFPERAEMCSLEKVEDEIWRQTGSGVMFPYPTCRGWNSMRRWSVRRSW